MLFRPHAYDVGKQLYPAQRNQAFSNGHIDAPAPRKRIARPFLTASKSRKEISIRLDFFGCGGIAVVICISNKRLSHTFVKFSRTWGLFSSSKTLSDLAECSCHRTQITTPPFHPINAPPFTWIVCLVTYRASSEHSNRTIAATLSGRPRRSTRLSGSAARPWFPPGGRPTHRLDRSRHHRIHGNPVSRQSLRESPSQPYHSGLRRHRMHPSDSPDMRRNPVQIDNRPTTRRRSASSRPNRRTASSTSPRACAGSVMSAIHRPGPACRAVTSTAKPSRARCSAIALPIFNVLPVTIATFASPAIRRPRNWTDPAA
jgi:hypothetical protein